MQLIHLQWEATVLEQILRGSFSGLSLKSDGKLWSQFGMHRTETILSWENRGRAGAEGTCVRYSGSAAEEGVEMEEVY